MNYHFKIMNKVYSKPIDSTLRKELFDAGYFGSKPEITGTKKKKKRDYYRRTGLAESSINNENVLVCDVLDWLREELGKSVTVDPYRDQDEIKYCGKVVDINTGAGMIGYSSSDFETALVSTIHDALKWK